ncbi:uncharacterized protein [Amphiura filiformis]|uniref:uncharacterized protein n=1 Tax=Amphiura filiformis TaxID=82378 RepID=UPI003B227159
MGANLSFYECLGRGASADAFRVKWKSQEHGKIEVAAKKMSLDEENPITPREIEFLKKLNHRNIIKYYDTVMEAEHVIILTEYASKGSLYRYLKDKDKLPENLQHTWMFHLACGIHYLQQNNVAHRDLKSPNCVITADDVLKICDFGLARDLEDSIKTNMKGTIRWLAPEAIQDQEISPKSDIFAFAIISWEILTCEAPYEGMAISAVMFQVCQSGLRPPIPQDCPPFLRDLMERCWHGDRNQRPGSSEIVKSLWREYKNDLYKEKRHFIEADDATQWTEQHAIREVGVVHFLSGDHLAICVEYQVEVHQVTMIGTSLRYTLTCNEWKGIVTPWDVAVSESMPESILLICSDQPCIYEFPRQEASQFVHKYPIQGGYTFAPLSITTNANTAVIAIWCRDELLVCSLPHQFNHQRIVRVGYRPFDVKITHDYLLVMGLRRVLIKRVGSSWDRCQIEPPDGCKFRAASFRDDARQVYVACYHEGDKKGYVYKYTWQGNDTPQYINAGCVIDDLGDVAFRGMAITDEGILAVSNSDGNTQIFSLVY